VSGTRGFTLLEVLIALVITASVLAAIMASATTAARAERLLRERTLAQWVARNLVAEIELNDPWPALGTRAGEARMAGQTWRWRTTASAALDRGEPIREVRVAVAGAATEAVLVQRFYAPAQP
jgi:general secretion pathway protein I